jgi:hypothetical protein
MRGRDEVFVGFALAGAKGFSLSALAGFLVGAAAVRRPKVFDLTTTVLTRRALSASS